MAAAEETLTTTHPASMGRPPEGTLRPVSAEMSCFSEPCGYLTRRTWTSMPRGAARARSASGGVALVGLDPHDHAGEPSARAT